MNTLLTRNVSSWFKISSLRRKWVLFFVIFFKEWNEEKNESITVYIHQEPYIFLLLNLILFNLSFDGVLKIPSIEGEGVESTPPFLFVKTIEKVIRLCTMLIFFWVVVLKIWVFLHIFIYLSVMGRYNPPPIRK